MKNKRPFYRVLIIFSCLFFTIINVWIAFDRNVMPDRVRTLNISQIMAGSDINDFPVWGDVAGDIQLNLTTEISSFSKVTIAPLGESVTLYYIPVIGKALGFYYPYISILIFYCLVLYLANYYALIYSKSKSDLFYIILANSFLIHYLAFYEFGIMSVYYAKGLIIILSFAFFAALDLKQLLTSGWVITLIFAILSNIRHSIGVVYLVCLLLIFIINYKNLPFYKLIFLIIIFYITKYFFGVVVITNANYLNLSQPIGHVFWHTIWCSIGAYDPANIYGFKWSDAKAWEFAINYAGHNVIFSSVEYEDLLKNYILEVFARDPKFILGYLMNRLFQDWYFYIALALNVSVLFVRKIQKSHYYTIFLSLLPISIFKAEEVFSISSINYAFPINIYIPLVFAMLILFLIEMVGENILLSKGR